LLTHRQIAAAVRIGMLSGERDIEPACHEALKALNEALPVDAATLIGLDPGNGAHFPVASMAESDRMTREMAEAFVRTPWYGNVVRHALPLSISDEPGQSYRRGWFYEEYVHPAGYRDGMTGALRHRGRYVGLISLATARPGAFDIEARRLLHSIMPALAALTDFAGRVCDLNDLPEDAAASLVTEDGIVDLPDRDRPGVLEDDAFRRLLAEFNESDGGGLRLLWPLDRQWYSVTLSRQELVTTRAVLVHSHPTRLPYGLSPRELDVLTRAAMGQSNLAIAQNLFLSPRTVHTHIEHILRKTGASSRAEAAVLAVREHVLRPVPGLEQRAGLECFIDREAAPDRSRRTR
jgi:DNA-binding CsgD family transcriptional regulator